MATKRLGKGLSALIPDIPEPGTGQQSESLTDIKISSISPNPFQPRTEFDPVALEDLKQSIKEKGIITPITVRPFRDGYQLIAGERRLRAVQELGLEGIPAFVLRVDNDEEMLELALIENIQRENLNPIEEALAYQRLIDECHLTQEQVAKNVGKERATVANFLRLLKLPKIIQESVVRGEISAGHARSILSCDDDSTKMTLWKKIVKSGLSVRQAEQFVKASRDAGDSSKNKPKSNLPPEVKELEDRLRQHFGSQVHISLKGKAGNIQLEFYSENDFERIVDLILNNN
ncbi:MAG: ParB/RepB/Spo0J family partition protein [Deferribacteres bacterium]|nr:ParB/RepB/Spo0J family partition protein [candidate division KSB1 bacterium]MCB9502973.1 ParB/RepB/Spo0J family partition protein [Deferribacteres bacterium]